MPGKVIGKMMNLGWIGKVTRDADLIIINRIAKEDIKFGAPVFIDGATNKFRNMTATDTDAKNFVGFAVSEVMQSTSYDGSAEVYYTKDKPCDVITRGSIILPIDDKESITAGGQVYITANGEITSVASTGSGDTTVNNIKLDNCKFTTGKIDANGCIEVTVITKNIL